MEFTAIYEPQPNGSVVAYVAELSEVTVRARNVEEARVQLAELLRVFLERERAEAIARAASAARIEPIAGKHPSKRQTSSRNGDGKPRRSRRKRRPAERDILAQLQMLGWIDRLPPPELLDDNFRPVRLPGRPVSEQIIQDRR